MSTTVIPHIQCDCDDCFARRKRERRDTMLINCMCCTGPDFFRECDGHKWEREQNAKEAKARESRPPTPAQRWRACSASARDRVRHDLEEQVRAMEIAKSNSTHAYWVECAAAYRAVLAFIDEAEAAK